MLDPFCGTATMSLARGSGRVWRSRVKVVGKNSALKHGRNSIGVELDSAYCKLAASRLMNESTLFGSAKLQIELKPHPHKNPSPPRSGRGTEGEVSLASAL